MSEPLFSSVGRRASTTEPKARFFQLVIVIGLLLATGLFLAELGGVTHYTIVEVDLSTKP